MGVCLTVILLRLGLTNYVTSYAAEPTMVYFLPFLWYSDNTLSDKRQ